MPTIKSFWFFFPHMTKCRSFRLIQIVLPTNQISDNWAGISHLCHLRQCLAIKKHLSEQHSTFWDTDMARSKQSAIALHRTLEIHCRTFPEARIYWYTLPFLGTRSFLFTLLLWEKSKQQTINLELWTKRKGPDWSRAVLLLLAKRLRHIKSFVSTWDPAWNWSLQHASLRLLFWVINSKCSGLKVNTLNHASKCWMFQLKIESRVPPPYERAWTNFGDEWLYLSIVRTLHTASYSLCFLIKLMSSGRHQPRHRLGHSKHICPPLAMIFSAAIKKCKSSSLLCFLLIMSLRLYFMPCLWTAMFLPRTPWPAWYACPHVSPLANKLLIWVSSWRLVLLRVSLMWSIPVVFVL